MIHETSIQCSAMGLNGTVALEGSHPRIPVRVKSRPSSPRGFYWTKEETHSHDQNSLPIPCYC